MRFWALGKRGLRGVLGGAVLLVGSAALWGQMPPPPPGVVVSMPNQPDASVRVPRFDVISVRPSKDSDTVVQFRVDGFLAKALPVQFLLLEGYDGLIKEQLAGEPAWAAEERFDIEAKVAEADMPALAKLTLHQRTAMLLQILTERFGLVAHEGRRELAVYELTVGKRGSKLVQAAPVDPASTAPQRDFMMFGPGSVSAVGLSLGTFVHQLSGQLGRVVVDKTGLTGKYTFKLAWNAEGNAPPGSPGANADRGEGNGGAADIFSAIQEQLGLKLGAGRAEVRVLLIDRLERPSAN